MSSIVNFIQFIVVFCALASAMAAAEQTHFSRRDTETNVQFKYQWQDHDQQLQDLTFTLSKQAIFEHFRQFKSYKKEFADGYVQQGMHKKLRQQPLAGVQVSYHKQNGQLQITVNGDNNHQVNEALLTINAMKAELFDEYLSSIYYHRFISVDGQAGIKPDHVSIADISSDGLKSAKNIILEKVEIKNVRKATNFVLSFVQSIPYSPLQSRVTSAGAGFVTPLTLLYQNKGDCDSKVTLTASMLRVLMPRIKMIAVYIDQHALIGIDIPSTPGETTITEAGTTYVLAEPTGPALYPLGQLEPMSEQLVLNGLYKSEVFN